MIYYANVLWDTYLKQSTSAANTLAENKKSFASKGMRLGIVKASQTTNNHYKITFDQPIDGYKTWCVFADHIGIPEELKPKDVLLEVPYFSQRDNAEEPWRTCNTSCCAMVAKYLGAGIKGDDDYFQVVKRFGDTTDHEAQTKALKSIGIDSDFYYNLDFEDLDKSLAKGKPIILGVLHRGSIKTPSGGGHMIVCIGKKGSDYIFHDPWGEGFSYESEDGKRVLYPNTSLTARWLCDGESSGWGRLFS